MTQPPGLLGRFAGVLGPATSILVLGGFVAAAVVWHPAAAVAGVAAGLALLVAHCSPAGAERLFLQILGVVLVGYALLGRSFAGLGLPPVYVGELALIVGLLSVVAGRRHFHLVRTPAAYLLVAFMTWGAVRTVPYLSTYGLDALRDAVVWGYGIFALLVASLLVRRNLVGRIPEWYGRALPWIIVCAPAWVILSEWTGLGRVPGSPLVAPKAGDVAVHLGGAAAFLLADVWTRPASDRAGLAWLTKWGASLALLVGLVAMGSLTRGGLMAAGAAILTVTVLLPSKAVGKILVAGVTAALVAVLWLGWGLSLQIREHRAISPEQIVRNLSSLGGSSGTDNLDGTRRWRLAWWNSIVDYTVHGKYFWTGKGFGLNIAHDDRSVPAHSLTRSPHNGHLTILARAGVPGAMLWGLLQLGFALTMLAGFIRAHQLGESLRASLFAWVLGYWLAFLVNATFDVYLEGPQGGIWFWCVVGFGFALLGEQRGQIPLPHLGVASGSRRAQALSQSRAG